MWFKNMRIFRLPARWAMSSLELENCIEQQAFQPCTSLEMTSKGWIAPRDGRLVYVVNQQMLLTLQTEKKLLPKSVITRFTKEKAAAIEEEQGFAPGRKQLKDLQEAVIDELMPRAFPVTSHVNVWIDPVHGWLAIDTTSDSKVDEVIKLLMTAIEQFPLQYLRTNVSPLSAMTDWIVADDAPAGFMIDMDSELRTTSEGKATVRYVNHTLDADDMRRHITSGKQCTRLAMTWNDRVSFVLTEGLTIKRIAALDVLKEEKNIVDKNDDDRFDADFVMMTGELNKLLTDVVDALGGEADQQSDLVQKAATVTVKAEIMAQISNQISQLEKVMA